MGKQAGGHKPLPLPQTLTRARQDGQDTRAANQKRGPRLPACAPQARCLSFLGKDWEGGIAAPGLRASLRMPSGRS
jgi:hypothetical protein